MTGVSLPVELQAAARAQLNEPEPEQLLTVVDAFRQRLQRIPDDSPIKPDRLDDSYLVMFLRHAKYREDRAYEKITNMARWKHEHAELVDNLTPQEFLPLVETGVLYTLPGKTRGGSRMTGLNLSKIQKYRGREKLWKLMLRFRVFNLQRVAEDPYLQVHGICLFQTLEGFSLLSMAKFNSQEARHYQRLAFEFMQECLPIRFHGIYIIHQPFYFTTVFATAKALMKAKLLQRIHFFGSRIEQLHELVEPSELPPCFGGTLPDKPTHWLELQIRADMEGKTTTGYR